MTVKKKPVSIGTALPRVLEELGFDGMHAALRITECWGAVVGEEFARHCRPTLLRGAVLEVSADSSVWSQELRFRRGDILAGLRRALGPDAPTDLRVHLG